MFQTLVLVPGQHGIFLEHNSRQEAYSVLHNVKAANAQHNGGEVTAIPLNYTDPADNHILLDLSNIPEDKKRELADNVGKYFVGEQIKLKEGQA